jgi:hypothetical protein
MAIETGVALYILLVPILSYRPDALYLNQLFKNTSIGVACGGIEAELFDCNVACCMNMIWLGKGLFEEISMV